MLREVVEVSIAFVVTVLVFLLIITVAVSELSVFVAGVFVVWGIPLPNWLKVTATLGIVFLAFDRIIFAYDYVKRR